MGGPLRSVNRTLLALTGLVLTALGLAVLVAGFGLPRHLGFSLPAEWPWRAPGNVLLSEGDRTGLRSESWWWPAIIAALAVLVLASLWWLAAQLRRRRLGEVVVDTGDDQSALLRGRALEDVLTAEAAHLPGVDGAAVRLTGRRTAPQAVVGLRLEPHAAPGPVLGRLTGEALEHARGSVALEALPAEVRLRAVKHRPERVQ